jgi:chorismate dehydratase
LIIGDRALMNYNRYKYVYDLGLGWKEMTGLPFVFAVWVSLKKISSSQVNDFGESLRIGITNIDIVQLSSVMTFDLRKYLTQNLSYLLDDEKRFALDNFIRHF